MVSHFLSWLSIGSQLAERAERAHRSPQRAEEERSRWTAVYIQRSCVPLHQVPAVITNEMLNDSTVVPNFLE
jgi:hypothetical protein